MEYLNLGKTDVMECKGIMWGAKGIERNGGVKRPEGSRKVKIRDAGRWAGW